METRTIEQVKVWSLKLNCIYDRAEEYEVVLLSTEKQKIIDYYNSNKCDSYKDNSYIKQFKRGSLLEKYNALNSDNLKDATIRYDIPALESHWIREGGIKDLELL